MRYFDRDLVTPKTIEQIRQVHDITDAKLDTLIEVWERMAVSRIDNKIKANGRMAQPYDFITDMVIDYVVGKGLQGSTLDQVAQERFRDFYTTLSSLKEDEIELKEETNVGIMCFNDL